MIWFLAIFGSVPIVGMAVTTDHDHDALFTMVGHVAIFGTALLTYAQTRSNGAKLDAAKVALEKRSSL